MKLKIFTKYLVRKGGGGGAAGCISSESLHVKIDQKNIPYLKLIGALSDSVIDDVMSDTNVTGSGNSDSSDSN